MRRARRCADRAELAAYERIIELYAPYVLVRCAGLTNNRRQAQQIGAYVLVCTCLLSGRLDHRRQLGVLVDVLTDVVGPDVVSGGEGRAWWGQCDELLVVDRRMRAVARGLNRLSRPLREALVLHYVAGMRLRALATLLGRPLDEVTARLGRGERLLAVHLRGPRAGKGGPDAADVPFRLTEFASGLDAGWIEEVARCAMEYLAGRGAPPRDRRN